MFKSFASGTIVRMNPRPALISKSAAHSGWTAVFSLLVAFCSILTADGAESKFITIDKVLAVQTNADGVALPQTLRPVTLPDDWSVTRPRFDGSVWYRINFDRPASSDVHDLEAIYIEHVCSNLEVYLNGQRIFSGGRMSEPITRNCQTPQLISLPGAILQDRGNLLELQVIGHALQRVASRHRAGGLSVIKVGAQNVLSKEYDGQLFWNITSIQIVSVVLIVLGCVMIGLGWVSQREAHLAYFGWLSVTWAVLAVRFWWRDGPWDTGVMESFRR